MIAGRPFWSVRFGERRWEPGWPALAWFVLVPALDIAALLLLAAVVGRLSSFLGGPGGAE